MSEPVKPSSPRVVRLRNPINFGGRIIEQLTIRQVKAKDLRRIKASDTNLQTTLSLASWLSGEIAEVIDELEGDDLGEVIGVVDGFFEKLQGTGQTPSGS